MDEQSPGEVVVAAYWAANKGRFARANRFLVPTLAKAIAVRGRRLMASAERLARTAKRLRDPGQRNRIMSVARAIRMLAPVRDAHFCWRAATRGRALADVTVTRQVIRGTRARVYLRLLLRNGKVEKDSEPLVQRSGKWLIGE